MKTIKPKNENYQTENFAFPLNAENGKVSTTLLKKILSNTNRRVK